MDTTELNPSRKTNTRTSAGWVLFGISLFLFTASIVISLQTPKNLVPLKSFTDFNNMAEGYADGVGFLAFGLVGAVLLRRGNQAGWAYLVPAVCYNSGMFAIMYAIHGLYVRPLPLTVQATLLPNALFLPTIVAALVFVPVLYPYGRTTRVWRVLLGILAVLVVVSEFLLLVTPGPTNAPDFTMANPWGIPSLKPVIDIVTGICIAAFIALAVAAAVWTIWRWIRQRGESRRVYGLFLLGELIFLGMFLLDNVMQPILPIWSWLAPLIAVPAIPLMTSLALLRRPGADRSGAVEVGVPVVTAADIAGIPVTAVRSESTEISNPSKVD